MSAFEFLTYKKISLILSLFDNLEKFFVDFDKNEKEICKVVGDKNFSKLKIGLDENFLNSYINSLNKNGTKVLTIDSNNYPEKLLHIDCPPYVLFCKGDIGLLNTDSIAIVGSRQPTAYGKKVTEMFSKTLANAGMTIVSGLAYGVDTIAHETCLDDNGKTIAVLGGGFNYIYPSSNTNLSEKIAKNGLLIT